MSDFVYLHGFNSSPQSLKAQETRSWLNSNVPDARFHCPQLSPHPSQALADAYSLLAGLPTDTLLIGSSLGGFYASWLAEALGRKAILINPAVSPHRALRHFIGPQQNPYTGEIYTLDHDDFAALALHQVLKPDLQRYWLILGTNDEVLDWRVAARHFQGCRQTWLNGDDHRLARWPECLPNLPAFTARENHFTGVLS